MRAVHPHSFGMSASTRVTWHLNTRGENRGCDSFIALLLLQLVPFFFSRLRSLFFCSSVTRGSRMASVDGYGELEEGSFLCWAQVRLSALLRGNKSAAVMQTVISAARECIGIHHRLKFICTNYTWGPLNGIKISFLLTCIKFYFSSRVDYLCKYRLYRNKQLQALLWRYGSTSWYKYRDNVGSKYIFIPFLLCTV